MKVACVTTLAVLLAATMLTPAGAADMTHERALNAAKEPQNWLLHYGNYEGHRFSTLWKPLWRSSKPCPWNGVIPSTPPSRAAG